jgi:hypothetical protein
MGHDYKKYNQQSCVTRKFKEPQINKDRHLNKQMVEIFDEILLRRGYPNSQ